MLKKHVMPNGTRLMFDVDRQVVEVEYPNLRANRRFFLNTEADLREHYQGLAKVCEELFNGKKVYWLLNYKNFDVNPDLRSHYVGVITELVARWSLAVVRYNSNLLQSTAIRFSTHQVNAPSHLYESRDEAMAAIEEMRRSAAKAPAR